MSVAHQHAAAPPAALHSVAETIRRDSGIVLGPAQLPALAASISRAAPGLDAAALLRELEEPVSGPGLLERVIDEVTVNETYFLRHRSELDPIDWHALHAAARRNGSPVVRVWSAACATGEEVYSLALLAVRAFAPAPPPVSILGTDIAPSALRTAARGAYGWRSVRGVEPPLRELHFHGAPEGLIVSAALREVTSFARHNLVRDPIPPAGWGPFELIVCRNVLIYFERETVAATRAALGRALAPGGHLVLGAADRVSGGGPDCGPCLGSQPRAPAGPRPRPVSPDQRPASRRAGVPDRPRPAPLPRPPPAPRSRSRSPAPRPAFSTR